MKQEFKLTQDNLDKLKQELEYLKTVRMQEVAEQIKEARSFGDLSENAEYDEAKNEQGRVASRIAELETIISHAVVISEDMYARDEVSPGCRFKVIDLGKDVEADTIVETAIQQDADIVGLAALMTTTMPQIDKVIDKLREAGARAKVMIGGAAVTQDYADSCGADAYAADGVKAVKLAKQIVGVE